MQSYIVRESTLTDIADAVREQTGLASPISLDSIPEQIRTLTDTSDANAVSTDLKAGKTAYVGGKKITGENVTVKIVCSRSGTLYYHDGAGVVTVALASGETKTIYIPKGTLFVIFASTTRQGSYTTYFPTLTVSNGSRVVDQRTFSVSSSSVTSYIFYYFITVKGNATVNLSKSTTLIRE